MAVVTYFSVSASLRSVKSFSLSSVTGINFGKRQIALIQLSFLTDHYKIIKVVFIAMDSIKNYNAF